MGRLLKKLSPGRVIALGFAAMILLGSLLFMLPVSTRDGVQLHYLDALYTSTSAVCVTGLSVVDAGDTFTPFGQFVLGFLIQFGGLGVALVGTGIMLIMGKKVDTKSRNLVREAMNLDSGRGILKFVRRVFFVTILFELLGTAGSFVVFARRYAPLKAVGLSIFHSVAAFNNSGFDILGGGQSLTAYHDDLWMNVVTGLLIILGGIGFLVLHEVREKKLRWKRFSMHTKVVLSMSAVLIVAGTLLLKCTEDMTWMEAMFQSISARTAGFATYANGRLSPAGRLMMMVWMVIGASPGSTGGGIKTTTVFALLVGMRAAATNESEKAFRYAMPRESFRKAAVITMFAVGIVISGSYLMMIMEPGTAMTDILYEVASAFGTAGLSTGITSSLCAGSKLLTIVLMYIGRLGPLTVASLWYFSKGERANFPEGNISIG